MSWVCHCVVTKSFLLLSVTARWCYTKPRSALRLLGQDTCVFPSCKEITSDLSVCRGHQPREALRKICAVVLLCSRWFLNHLQHLKQQQEGLSHLISIIKDDLEDIKLIEHGLNESIPIRGGVFS